MNKRFACRASLKLRFSTDRFRFSISQNIIKAMINPIRVTNISFIIRWFAPLKMPCGPIDRVELNDISDRRELNLPNLLILIPDWIDLAFLIGTFCPEFWKVFCITEKKILILFKRYGTKVHYFGRRSQDHPRTDFIKNRRIKKLVIISKLKYTHVVRNSKSVLLNIFWSAQSILEHSKEPILVEFQFLKNLLIFHI